jgi:hypothetical protein
VSILGGAVALPPGIVRGKPVGERRLGVRKTKRGAASAGAVRFLGTPITEPAYIRLVVGWDEVCWKFRDQEASRAQIFSFIVCGIRSDCLGLR